MRTRFLFVILMFVASSWAAEIKGKVTNAGGEALERVEVLVLEVKAETVTSAGGSFLISNLRAGNYTLRLNAVGYRMLTIPVAITDAREVKEFSITMVPDNFHHTDKVEVHGDVFQIADSPATTEQNLTATEIRETSTVFADDPFRAVQTLPGVSAEGNNEFFAEFSVMGAGFSNMGVYIDDVLVQNPFHQIGNFAEGASLGVLTSEVVEEMKLLPVAYPEKFGDGDGAALDIHTRDGSRAAPLFRISAGVAASEILGEGELGAERKGSWLLSARKSYINYLIRSRVQDATDVGFEDADLKLSYDLTSRQNVNLFVTDGHTNMAVNDPASLVNDEYASGNSDFTFARAGWRWTLSPRLLVEAHGAYIREPDQLFNNANVLLSKDDHREWVGGTEASWAWANDQVLQAGWIERELKDSQYSYSFPNTGPPLPFAETGTGLRQIGFVQQTSGLFSGRVHFLGSLRWDSMSGFDIHPLSPQASLALQMTRSTQLQFAAGKYQQFTTSPLETGSLCGLIGFMPEKSTHFTAAVEQRLGEKTRIRLQAFDRQDSWPLGVLAGFHGPPVMSPCPSLVPLPNSAYQRDYSRGAQLIVQRRSANRLSGWLGYTFVRAQERQFQVATPVSPYSFSLNTSYYPTLEDQRHTLNVFAMYRLRPSFNLSGKWLYGSGVPVPSGSYIQLSNGQYVQVGFNELRLGTYARLDVRADKDWAFDRWKLTLYSEVLNLTNHYNERYFYTSGIDTGTGQEQVKTLQGLPITPTAGLVFQF
jgi:hypothetical protein